MKNFSKYKAILWDFDGVLMDSMPVRDRGFEIVLATYPETQREALLTYHRANGGLSRYVKFRYFFESIRGESVTDDQILVLAAQFSDVMIKQLCNVELLIADSLGFVKQHADSIPMHIVSGSDQNELRYLCKQLNIQQYFQSIHGSPTPKRNLVQDVLLHFAYEPQEVVLIGDSVNDFEAASANKVDFVGYNNEALRHSGIFYVDKFHEQA